MMTPREALKKYFGYSDFRPLQEDIVATTLAGIDLLVLMPTGGGKSICFQLPALLLPGRDAGGLSPDFFDARPSGEPARSRHPRLCFE